MASSISWVPLLTSVMTILLQPAWLCDTRLRWKWLFTLDVVAHGHIHSFSGLSFSKCVHSCTELAACQMFSYNSASTTCSLYDQPLDPSSSGTVAPNTRYWGTLCPLGLEYSLKSLKSRVCYKLVDTYRTWEEARGHCRSEGGDLLIGDTPEKLGVLGTVWSYTFVGGVHQEGALRWTNGEPVQGAWDPYLLANTSGQGCAAFFSGVLFGFPCTSYLPSVCEIPL